MQRRQQEKRRKHSLVAGKKDGRSLARCEEGDDDVSLSAPSERAEALCGWRADVPGTSACACRSRPARYLVPGTVSGSRSGLWLAGTDAIHNDNTGQLLHFLLPCSLQFDSSHRLYYHYPCNNDYNLPRRRPNRIFAFQGVFLLQPLSCSRRDVCCHERGPEQALMPSPAWVSVHRDQK
ncbi:hypothetical protein VTN02DRAFT_447 [Thermoascus thermophilus]